MKKISFWALALAALGVIGCTKHVAPKNAGPFGSTCQSTNDCATGLVCVSSICINQNLPLDPTAMICQPVDCAVDADCAALEKCVNQQCTFTCATDQNCVDYFGWLDACEVSTGECWNYDCMADADCNSDEFCDLNVGTDATQGACRTACASDVNCDAFEQCNTATKLCEWVGCKTDRECAFNSGGIQSAYSQCNTTTGQCQLTCSTDSDCFFLLGNVAYCMDGVCTSLGCQTSADCRADYGPNYDCVAPTTP